ncbi:choline transporter, partial [Alteromonas sp. 14N.309.X.WAT.G.H12]
NDQPDFIYAVHLTSTSQPDLNGTLDTDEDDTYYRADVHLSEGGQGYDIMGWSKLAVINDVIDHYHKHQHFLHRLV